MNKGAETSGPNLTPLAGQLIVLGGAAITGWSTLTSRFQRMRKMANESSHLELSFRVLYWFPQYVNGFIMLALAAGVVLALIGGLMGDAVPALHLSGAGSPFGRIATETYRLGWILVLAGLAATILVTLDLIARGLVFGARLLALLPISLLEGHFGPDGRSLGWVQAREFLQNGKDASPLSIDSDGLDRVVGPVYADLTGQGATGADRAPTPRGSAAVCGNIALFACIIEQAESDLRLPRRKLERFYAAFDDVHQASGLFEPTELRTITTAGAFWSRLLAELNAALQQRQDLPLTGVLALQEDVEGAFKLLVSRFCGDTTKLAERRPLPFYSKAYGLSRRAALFPRLAGDRMRLQFVKLCLRWKAIPLKPDDVLNPAFAYVIAWRMVEDGAVTPLSDIKDISFLGTANRSTVRIAAGRVLRKISDRLEILEPKDAPNLLPDLQDAPPHERRWMIEQEVDTTLWRQSRAMHDAALAEEWKGRRWKLEASVAHRV